MAHIPGQMDFNIEQKEFPVTVLRRRISSIWAFVENPGCIAIITRKGRWECVMMSIETYACISSDYEAEMIRVKEACSEYKGKKKAARRTTEIKGSEHE